MTQETFKILAVIFLGVVLAVVLKNYKPEFSVVFAIFLGAVVTGCVLKNVFPAIKNIYEIFENGVGNNECFNIVLKALGISYIADFCADVCNDFGQTSFANKAILAGKCGIFVLCVPLINNVLKTAIGFINL